MPGGERVAIAILRNPGPVDPALFVDMAGVIQAIPVSRPYKLVSREMNRKDTVIHLPGGGPRAGGISWSSPVPVRWRAKPKP